MAECNDGLVILHDLLVKPDIELVTLLPVAPGRHRHSLTCGVVEIVVKPSGFRLRDDGVQNGKHLFRSVRLDGGVIVFPKARQHEAVLGGLPPVPLHEGAGCYGHKAKDRHKD